MEKVWVDFRAIKAQVTITQVLDHYGINWLRKEQDELVGRCPIHRGDGERTFHVSVDKNVFHCFSCKKRGNVLDLVAAIEECSIRDAALKLKEWFPVTENEQQASEDNQSSGSPGALKATSVPASEAAVTANGGGEGRAINRPLSFQLKGIDPTHPYLAERGITEQTAVEFGAGFFPGKGSMAGRIVIPIFRRGELLAYAGRSIDGSDPKYKLPVGFQKSLELFNFDKALGPKYEVIVVEGFFDCMKVWQAGYRNVVALMGCSLSKQQEERLVSCLERVTIMLDGDDAGRKATTEIADRLMRTLYVRVIDLPTEKQPDGLSEQELQLLLET